MTVNTTSKASTEGRTDVLFKVNAILRLRIKVHNATRAIMMDMAGKPVVPGHEAAKILDIEYR